jgi:asparagine synthase (glutamine-hydrolysing)
MCGIAGYFSFKPDPTLDSTVRSMATSILHRGPDEYNYAITKSQQCGLAQTRLSIIDIEKGKQPFVSDLTRNVIVYNGELYNFPVLKAELQAKGVSFSTHSDTEVLLKAYEYWGMDFIHRLSGMFAFIIYDKKEDKYVIARDRFGIKPLYYFTDDSRLIIASEIKAILSTGKVKPVLNQEYLLMQLSYGHAIDDSTLFHDIRYVLPGEMYTFRNGMLQKQTYYSLSEKEFGTRKVTFSGAREEVSRLLNESVQRHLLADVKVVTSLSGGLDSSIVASVASSYQPIEAFSIGYGRTDDEIPYAEKVAQKHKLAFHTHRIDIDELNENLVRLLYHLEEPLPHTQVSTTFFASHFVKNSLHAKVCLLGEGSDEIFAGYTFPKMASEFKSSLLGKKYIYHTYKRMFYNLLPDYRGPVFLQKDSEIRDRFYETDRKRFRRIKAASRDNVHFMMLCDFQDLLPNSQLNRVDKLYMANSIEARVPFLDPELVEYVWSLPTEYKLGPPEKKVARDAFKNLIPKEVYERSKYGSKGSQNPFSTWWGGGLKEILEKEIREGLAKREIFNPALIEAALSNKLPNNPKAIMILGFLEILLKLYADNNHQYLAKATGAR